MSVQEIEAAIQALSPADRAKLATWFAAYQEQEWDAQIERDLDDGRLDALLQEAHDDISAGRVRPLP